LKEFVEKVSELSSTVAKMHNEMLQMKASIATHSHTVAQAVALPSIDFATYTMLSTAKDLQTLTNNLAQN
jgi:hypothetical protein